MSFLIDFFKNLINVIIINSYLKVQLRDSEYLLSGHVLRSGEQMSMPGHRASPVSYVQGHHQPSLWFGPTSSLGVFIFSNIPFNSCQVGLMVRWEDKEMLIW